MQLKQIVDDVVDNLKLTDCEAEQSRINRQEEEVVHEETEHGQDPTRQE